MSLTVRDGDLVEIDPLDLRLLTFDWDSDNLDPGVVIASSTFAVAAVRPDGQAVTSVTRSGATATATTALAHGYTTGDWVSIEGADQSGYNITAQVVVTGTTTFTFTVSGSPTSPATGTITAVGGIGLDNPSILSASPFDSRSTQVRVIGGGSSRWLGRLFELSNTIVTNETPAQTKNRYVRVVIADL